MARFFLKTKPTLAERFQTEHQLRESSECFLQFSASYFLYFAPLEKREQKIFFWQLDGQQVLKNNVEHNEVVNIHKFGLVVMRRDSCRQFESWHRIMDGRGWPIFKHSHICQTTSLEFQSCFRTTFK